MAGYQDPWAWMQGEQVPKPQNTLPQLPQTQAPSNLNGPTMGPLTQAAQARAINYGFEKALPAKPPVVDAVPVSDAVPTSYGVNTPTAPPNPISTPVQGPATGTEAIQAQPLPPLPAPVEPTVAAATQGSEIAGAAQAAETAGLAVQTAGMTAAELEAFLAAQQAAAALAAQQAAAAAVVLV